MSSTYKASNRKGCLEIKVMHLSVGIHALLLHLLKIVSKQRYYGLW